MFDRPGAYELQARKWRPTPTLLTLTGSAGPVDTFSKVSYIPDGARFGTAEPCQG
ncbi:hypothetical protein GCM10027589_25760 [Actinocorallia lasiicapitis]